MAQGALAVAMTPAGGVSSSLNVTAGTVVKATKGRLMRVSVIVAGSTVGGVYDRAATAGVAAANQIGSLPNTVGTTVFDWPCAVGITVVPGTGQTVAVSYT